MPKENETQRDIKEAKFIKALVDTGGNLTEAYKATRPQVTRDSANVLGSKALSAISKDDTREILTRVGCTKEAVLQGIWDRMKTTKKLGEYTKGAQVVCKIGGYYTPSNGLLKDLMNSDVDLVEIIKIRLKSKPKNDLQQKEPIDIKSNVVSNESAS